MFSKAATFYRRGQYTVNIPIGNHVNVLQDYKKTRRSKPIKLIGCR